MITTIDGQFWWWRPLEKGVSALLRHDFQSQARRQSRFRYLEGSRLRGSVTARQGTVKLDIAP
jgi:hypothetical protein